MKKVFTMYTEWSHFFLELNNEQAGELVKAIYAHEIGEEYAIEDSAVRMVFGFIQQKLEEMNESYEDVREKRKKAANKRWNDAKNEEKNTDKDEEENNPYANECKSMQVHNVDMQTDASECKDMPKVKDKDKEKVKEKVKDNNKKESKPEKKRKRFSPPTLDEVEDYCLERNNRVDAQRFIDYYQARDWILSNGKKMADWKAAVRTWERNDFDKRKEKPQSFLDLVGG